MKAKSHSKELGIYLTFNRLSMIDLTENGSQPMFSFSRSLILFNGEIYNFSELKKILYQMDLNDQISDTRIALEYIVWVNNFLELCGDVFDSFINLVEKEIFFKRSFLSKTTLLFLAE